MEIVNTYKPVVVVKKEVNKPLPYSKLRTPPAHDIKCKFCGYSWKKRVAVPKECSFCKKRNFEEQI